MTIRGAELPVHEPVDELLQTRPIGAPAVQPGE
jgi:hypothetical protein